MDLSDKLAFAPDTIASAGAQVDTSRNNQGGDEPKAIGNSADKSDKNAQSALVDVVRRLLQKNPDARYQDADAVIADLCAAIGQSMPAESSAIRNSFLQAAPLIGRETELAQLVQALSQALKGKGSTWLIGGESGVGKSRLLDELATRALVQGILVLRGQAVEDGGALYQLWRDPLRRLALSVALNDQEASILKDIVPDIEQLLGRPIPNTPTLLGVAYQSRLTLAVLNLFRRQRQPVLLLAEDLHWSDESLDMLNRLSEIAGEFSLLIIGSYRNDEKPDLPKRMPSVQILQLNRLTAEAISALSAAMLGEGGKQEHVVDLLQRETEGNVLFLIEVVRALAEESGRLANIGRVTLPQSVFTEGIQQILRRRLKSVPESERQLLKLAAVAGRALDLTLLQRVTGVSEAAVEGQLTICSNASVLEVREGRWRFAHDKLRQTLLADMGAERANLNRQVAEAIEALYPNKAAHYVTLFEHWQAAGEGIRAARYGSKAGQQLFDISRFNEAVTLLERTLTLLRANQEHEAHTLQINLQVMLGTICMRRGEYATAKSYLEPALALARTENDQDGEAGALNMFGQVAWKQGEYAAARDYHTRSLELRRNLGDRQGIATSYNNLAVTLLDQGEYAAARDYHTQGLELRRELGDQYGMAVSLNNLGVVSSRQGDYITSHNNFSQSLAIYRELGDRYSSAGSLNNLGTVAYQQGDLVAARDYISQSLTIQRELGDRHGSAITLSNLGAIAGEQGEYAIARDYHMQSLALRRDLNDQNGIAITLQNLGMLADYQGDYGTAFDYFTQSLSIRRQLGEPYGIAESLSGVGLAALHQGNHDLALNNALQSVALFREIGEQRGLASSLYYLAFVYLALKDLPAARRTLAESLQIAHKMNDSLISLQALVGFARWYMLDNQAVRSAELAGLVMATPNGTTSDVQRWLGPLRVELTSVLSSTELETAITRGKSQSLNEVIAMLQKTVA